MTGRFDRCGLPPMTFRVRSLPAHCCSRVTTTQTELSTVASCGGLTVMDRSQQTLVTCSLPNYCLQNRHPLHSVFHHQCPSYFSDLVQFATADSRRSQLRSFTTELLLQYERELNSATALSLFQLPGTVYLRRYDLSTLIYNSANILIYITSFDCWLTVNVVLHRWF